MVHISRHLDHSNDRQISLSSSQYSNTHILFSTEHFIFDDPANDVCHRDVSLLDALRIIGRNDDGYIDHLLRRASPLSKKSDHGHSLLLRLANRAVHVLRFAAGTDGNERIA